MALQAMWSRCHQIKLTDPLLLMKLFDSLVRSRLLYGCEIWGADLHTYTDTTSPASHYDIEKVHVQFLKQLLQVRKATSGTIVRGETGRLPISYNIWCQIIKYWNRLEEMEESRIVKRAFNHSLHLASLGHLSWAGKIYPVLTAIVGGQINADSSEIKSCLKKQCTQIWKERTMDGGTMSKQYLPFNPNGELQKYLTHRLCPSSRREIAQLRTGSHSLNVERQKWDNTHLKSPVCSLCSAHIEDIEHVLLKCPFYEDIRSRYIVSEDLSRYCVNTWWQLHSTRFRV